jgi:hypothetical protein
MGLAVIFRDFVLFLFVQLCCLSRLKNGDPLTALPSKNFRIPHRTEKRDGNSVPCVRLSDRFSQLDNG